MRPLLSLRSVSTLVPLLVAALSVVLVPRLVRAQESVACDACASCTTALAQPRARAHIEADLDSSATGACIVVAGAGAQFDGRNHVIRGHGAGSMGVQVTGAGVLVRNVNVTGAAVGIDVSSAERTTIFHATLDTRDTGIRVNAARSVRIARSHITGAHVGIAFGEANGTSCTDGPLRSPSAVIARNVLERNGTAIVACDAAPVLTDNVIVRNQIGLVLGAPSRGTETGPAADGPYDPCLCAPPYEHIRASTTVLYSSGCGSCQVHEGWLPDLHRSGHDIVARETGLDHIVSGQHFDDFIAQCVPEIWDSLGISGCVPNYACLASDVVAKNREGVEGLRFEARLDSPDDVAHFAETCAAAARADYRDGAACVRYALRGNVVCANRGGDIHAAPGAHRFGGARNACGSANGWTDEGVSGCALPCPAALPTTADAPAPSTADNAALAHAAPPTAVAPQPAPTPAVAPALHAPSAPIAANPPPSASDATATTVPAPPSRGPGKTVLMIACLVGIAALLGFALTRPS